MNEITKALLKILFTAISSIIGLCVSTITNGEEIGSKTK